MNADPIDKSALRRDARRRLAELPPDQVQRRSGAVCQCLIESGMIPSGATVLLYLPVAGSAEVDLADVALWVASCGGRTCWPRVDWDSLTMTPVHSPPDEVRAEVRRHGVPEPAAGTPVPAQELDAILIPGLAFDAAGGRLGRGAGFYDRFLAPLRRTTDTSGRGSVPRPWLCGVGFEEQIVPRVPMLAHDVRLDAIATDARLITVPRAAGPRL